VSEATRPDEPRILERPEHPISRKNIAENATKVLYRLHNAGFKAYLVGGGVRDLLLGRQPKDFDAATDARPNEIRRLFRNSRIIGRRFRLAHVYFKDDIVEVSTFRRNPDPEEQESAPGDLLITSDNTFGTPRQDAFRRDFTINALFYNIGDFSVIDYVGGIEDLADRTVRVIGDPDVRFQEDPVRMLRACEFAARLGFGIESGTQEGIERQKEELTKASPARMTEEIIQLMRCGHAGSALQWMLDLGLLEVLLPEAYAMVTASSRGLGDFGSFLPAIDKLVAAGETPSDTVLLAALLLPSVLLRRYDVEAIDGRPMRRTAIDELVAEVIEPFAQRFTLPRGRGQDIHNALLTFQDLADPNTPESRRLRIARRSSFADALQLLAMMVRATGQGEEVLAEWSQRGPREGAVRPGGTSAPREEGGDPGPVSKKGGRRPRRRRRRKKVAGK